MDVRFSEADLVAIVHLTQQLRKLQRIRFDVRVCAALELQLQLVGALTERGLDVQVFARSCAGVQKNDR